MRYSGTNVARKSVPLTKISNCAQGELSIEAYFDKLNKYLEEYDSIRKDGSCPQDGACACCTIIDEEQQENRVVKFLMRLNDGYGVVRSNIFAMRQVPRIDVVYDMVCQEET